MDIDQRVLDIIDKLEAHNYFVLITGGFVRDALLHKRSRDYDLVTNADLEVLDALFNIDNKYYVKVKEQKIHTVSVIEHEGIFVEITRFRTERYDKDFNLQAIEFVDAFEEDVLRRDFTINAIGYNNKIVDPLNGLKDLEQRTLRSIGDPLIRFQEDPSRMIRALRLSTTLSLTLDDAIKDAIDKHKKLILKSKNINNDLKFLLSSPSFGELYQEQHAFFSVLSNGRFKNVYLKDRTVLLDDRILLAYLVYSLNLNYDNTIYKYLNFSIKDKKFILKCKTIVKDLEEEKKQSDIVLYFITEGQQTMLLLYDILKALDLGHPNNKELIKTVYFEGYLKIDQLDVNLNDLSHDYNIKQKYKILKDIQKEIVQERLKNKKSDIIRFIDIYYK